MVRSRANVVHLKIKRTLIGVYREVKQIACPEQKEQKLPGKKKAAGRKGKTVVANTQKAKVRNMNNGGAVSTTKPKRKFNGKNMPGTAVARGCGAIMANRRKRTKGAVTQS